MPASEHAGTERVARSGEEDDGLGTEGSARSATQRKGGRARSSSAAGVGGQGGPGQQRQGRRWAPGDKRPPAPGHRASAPGHPGRDPAAVPTSAPVCGNPRFSKLSLGTSMWLKPGAGAGRVQRPLLVPGWRWPRPAGLSALSLWAFPSPGRPRPPFYLLGCTWLVYFGGPESQPGCRG